MERLNQILRGKKLTPLTEKESAVKYAIDNAGSGGGGGGGGDLPEITVSDVGKVLTAAEDGAGGYVPTWDTVEDGIPVITESDVGKVLTAAEDGEGGYIPAWDDAGGGGGSVQPLFILIAESEYGSPSVVGWTNQNYATKAGEVVDAILEGTPVYIKAGEYDGTAGDIPDANITLLAPVVAAVPEGDSVFSIRSALHAYQDANAMVVMGYSISLGGFGISIEKINYELEIAAVGG